MLLFSTLLARGASAALGRAEPLLKGLMLLEILAGWYLFHFFIFTLILTHIICT
jgi:hypothetical protein